MQEVTHKAFGVGVRRMMRNTVAVEVFAQPPSPLETMVRVRTPNKTLTLANGIAFSSLTGDLHIKQAETDETVVRTSGVIHLLAIPPGELLVPEPVQQEPTREKQPRVKVSGFFGKVLDGYPQQTQDSRTIYKLLIGNFSETETRPDGAAKKIEWVTVTALESHVVKFLEEHLASFEKRKTRLTVAGYFQDVEKKLRRSTKIVQELYAEEIKQAT